jgi:hypothetical protein
MWAALLSGLVVLPTVAKAADFPSQLWGRSVVAIWSTHSEDQRPAVSFNGQLSVYVSSAGRTFGRMATDGSRAMRSEQGPVNTAASTPVSVSFENGVLAADAKTVRSALHVTITFDAAYARCNATLIFAAGGETQVRGNAVGASDCLITDGNVFVGR